MSDDVKKAIEAEIARTSARVEALRRSFEDVVRSAEGSPPDDEHDPDGTTSGFERAQIAALLAQAEEDEAELRSALERVSAGTYGTCEACGRPIGQERLRARPSVRTCVACARAKS